MKKKKIPAFRIFYLCFVLTCVVFWILVIRYVHGCLDRYEAAQPERVIEKLSEKIVSGGVDSVFHLNTVFTRFESLDFVKKYYAEGVIGETISWRQDKSSYNVSAPVYRFYAGEKPIGSVTLRETSSQPLMFILSLSEWEVDSAVPALAAGQESISVTVPDTYRVLINDVAVGAEEATGKVTVPEQFQYAKDYVAVPRLVEYQVQNLLVKPTVKILDTSGKALEYKETYEAGHTEITVDTFSTSVMNPQLEAMVLENAKRYSNFFSRDLPGCQASTKPLADMFPEDSYYMTLAETYRREDMWMYSAHSQPSFEKESVTNYICYSDDFFSCEVYFEKKIPLTRMNVTRTDITHMNVFYGCLNGIWKILDMQTLID